jgi:hypothetical protein
MRIRGRHKNLTILAFFKPKSKLLEVLHQELRWVLVAKAVKKKPQP